MSQNIVNALGAGSGIDTQALVASLVEVERAAPQQRIDNKRETTETQISDFGLLSSALSTLKDASVVLGNSDTFNSKQASFSDSTAFIPDSLDPSAQLGDYSFTVTQLAQAQSLSSASFTNTTDAVGEGTLTFSFGSWDVVTPPADPTTFTANTAKTDKVITIDGTNNTLAGLAKAIHDADFGVQASVVNDGSGHRLVTRAESGLTNQLRITVSESGGSPTNTDNTGLSRFAFNPSAFQQTQNQVGQDSALTVNGLSVTRSTNTIDDVVDGFQFTLSGLTAVNETVSVSINEDKSAGEQAVRDFFTAYNTFLEALEPITGCNEETDAFGSLANDSLAKSVPSQIRQLLVGNVAGLSGDFTSLTNIGIRTELDGSLSIDEDDFTAAINDNYTLFKNLFIPVNASTTDQITINSSGTNTTEGEYAVVISQTPTKGQLVGADMSDTLVSDLTSVTAATSATLTGAAPTAVLADFVSAASNAYDFTIAVDGTTSGTVSITPGTYASFNDLATHLTTQINADSALTAAGKSVTVTHNGSEFVITSSSTGVASTLANATAVGSSQIADLGITAGSLVQGVASEYAFTITVNGTTSGAIDLASGVFADKDAVAAELQSKINADTTLIAAGALVDVSYDSGSDAFTIISRQYGSTSAVTVTNQGTSAADLALASGTSTSGVNVAGTIDGVAGFGTGNVLLPALGQPGESLGLIIGESATSATVNFSRGFGGQLERLIDQFLESTGVIKLREDSLKEDITDLDQDQKDLDRRIEAYQERITSQFIAMEAIVRSLQDSGSFLTTTLDNLLNANNNNN